jgi:hypothetical protein
MRDDELEKRELPVKAPASGSEIAALNGVVELEVELGDDVRRRRAG